jgi:hypothetical protein
MPLVLDNKFSSCYVEYSNNDYRYQEQCFCIHLHKNQSLSRTLIIILCLVYLLCSVSLTRNTMVKKHKIYGNNNINVLVSTQTFFGNWFNRYTVDILHMIANNHDDSPQA